MSKIQLVIEIDEDLYERWINPSSPVWMRDTQVVYEALKKSTPLPKGHGDLIDANKIHFENSEFDTYGDYSRAFDAIDQAEVIIEADKEGEDAI